MGHEIAHAIAVFRNVKEQSDDRDLLTAALLIPQVASAETLRYALVVGHNEGQEGRIPLHTLRADIDYALSEARTTYGIIGVKVWVYKGMFTDSEDEQLDSRAAGARALRRPARKLWGGRR